MYTQTHNQSYSIKLLLLLSIGAMLIGFTTLKAFAQDSESDSAMEEVTQEINGLRAKHSALKAQVDVGEITKEEARAKWQALIDDVRARKKTAFDTRIDTIQARYERIYERNPELAEKLEERIESAHSRRAEVAENRRELNQRVRDGEITREEARVIHLENAQAMQERQEAFQENRQERRDDRTPPPPPSDGSAGEPPPRLDGSADTSSSRSGTGTSYVSGDVTIVGGHETDPVDGGRPVFLIGAILGISGKQFREAFSGVTPEDQGHLTEAATANKAILLEALSPYGITNDEIDTATNYYRYPPASTEIWPYTNAEINAVIEDGSVTGFEIINGGNGYTSEPTLTVEGYGTIPVDITISYSQSFSTNGAITSILLR